jgi:serine/threonine protein kinase
MVHHIEDKKNYVAKVQKIDASSHKALAEWQILVNLDHKNVVGTKECFYDENNCKLTFIIELCDGTFKSYWIGFMFTLVL